MEPGRIGVPDVSAALPAFPIVTKSIVNALSPVPKVSVMVWAEQIAERDASITAE